MLECNLNQSFEACQNFQVLRWKILVFWMLAFCLRSAKGPFVNQMTGALETGVGADQHVRTWILLRLLLNKAERKKCFKMQARKVKLRTVFVNQSHQAYNSDQNSYVLLHRMT